MRRSAAKNEKGAVAIVAAFTALVLVGICAFAVDLGNAFARKRWVQGQADFAALAGADRLGIGNVKSAADPAVIAVADYLTKNKPPQDNQAGPLPNITPDQLVNGDDTDGEVYFTGDRMRVVAPRSFVQYALGGVLGVSDNRVHAEASVKIMSGGAVMPFFAVDGCDWGPQVISTPPPGPAPGLNLALPDNGNATLTAVTPNATAANASPSPALTIDGDGFKNGADATKVGFFLNDGATYREVPITTPITNTQISIPSGALGTYAPDVLTTEQVWYVRVFKGTSWSKIDNAQPLRVGSAVMECVGAASQGNFGSLLLPRTDSNNSSSGGWLPINIAEGLQDPITLAVHKGASSGSNWNCTDGVNGAVVSPTSPAALNPGTNCLDTDTGLPDTSATAGFVTGGSNGSGKTFTGRLDKPTTPGCGAQPSNRDAQWATGITVPSAGQIKINDDLLTCFLDPSVNINTISQASYSGPPVFNENIYRSPRFFLQPILGRKPTCGGCEKYSIIGFRPAFVTDQPTSAVGGSMTMGTSTDHNGLSVSGGKISMVKVVFFNINALPPPPDDVPMSDYIGAGPKIIRLIN